MCMKGFKLKLLQRIIINHGGYSCFNKPMKYYSVYRFTDKLVASLVPSQKLI